MSARLVPVVAALLSALMLAPLATALETRFAREQGAGVVVGADEVVDDNLIAAGTTVVVEGTVTGNLLAFGRTIEIRGEVLGDVLTAGEDIETSGRVGGNWISFSETLESDSAVERSLAAFGELIELNGETLGDIAVFASQATLSAPIGNDVYAFGGLVEANSSIGGNLETWAGQLIVGPEATIEGDVTARAREEDSVSINPSASIQGATITRVDEPEEERPSRYATAGFYIRSLFGFLAALVTGLALYRLLPGLVAWRGKTLEETGKAAGIGFLLLVATPVAAVIAAVTLIGLPLGLMALTAWGASLYLAKIAVAPAIGSLFLSETQGGFGAFFRSFTLGLAAITILRMIPILGGLMGFLVLLVGLGALGLQAYRMSNPEPASPAA